MTHDTDSQTYQAEILLLLLAGLLAAAGILGYLGWSISAFIALGAFLVPAIAAGALLILSFIVLMQRVVWPLLSGLISYVIKKRVENSVRAALTESDPKALKTWLTIAAGQQEFTPRCWTYHFSSGESVWRYALQESDRLLADYQKTKLSAPQQLSSLFKSQNYMRQIFVCWQEKYGLMEAESVSMSWGQKLILWLSQRLGISWKFTEAPMDPQSIRKVEREKKIQQAQALEKEKKEFIVQIETKMEAAQAAAVSQQVTLISRLFNYAKKLQAQQMSLWWLLLLGGVLSVIALWGYLGWSIPAFLALGATLGPIITGGILLFLSFILWIQRGVWPLLRHLKYYYSNEAEVQQRLHIIQGDATERVIAAWRRSWLSLKDILSLFKILAELKDKEPVVAYEEQKNTTVFTIEQQTVTEEYSPKSLLERRFSLPRKLNFAALAGFESGSQTADSAQAPLTLQQRVDQAQHQQERLQQEEHEKKHQEQKSIQQVETVVSALAIAAGEYRDDSDTFGFYEKCKQNDLRKGFLEKIHQGLLKKYPGIGGSLITENAWNIVKNALKKAGLNTILIFAATDDLENLPKGFFYEKDAACNRYILKYSAKLYEEQRRDPKQRLRSDLTNKLCDSIGAGDIVKDEKELFAYLAKRLSPEQNKFLSELKEKKHDLGRIYSGALQCIFCTLERYFNEQESPWFIEALIKCNDKKINIIKKDGFAYCTETLLDALLLFLHDSSTFTGTKNIRNLSRLANLDDKALSWLYEFPMYNDSDSKNLSVVLECFLAFVDFFAERNLALPKITERQDNVFFITYLVHLKNLIAYVQLSSYPGLQTRLLLAAPKNSALAKSQLLKGYSVVHAAMCLEGFAVTSLECSYNSTAFDRFFEFKEPFMLLADDLEKIKSTDLLNERGELKDGAFLAFRALFLRYIAFNGTGSDFEAALKQWKQLIEDDLENYCLDVEIRAIKENSQYLQRFSSNLVENWAALKDYALQFRKNKRYVPEVKEQRRSEYKFAEDINSPAQIAERAKQGKKYNEEDLKVLLGKLKLPEEEAKAICEEIAELNNQVDQLDPMKLALAESVKQVREAGKDADSKQETTNRKLLHYLAELREAHYQHTTVVDGSKLVKRGEWLRLEQVVAILLAIRGKRLFQIDTSDGKTLIIRMAALLAAAQGRQVDVWTHNESLAERDCDEAQWLAYLSGLQVCKKSQAAPAVAAADIFYVDVSAAVLNDEIPPFYGEEKKSERATTRQSDEVLIDELDHIVIDVHASTTMQLAEGIKMADPQNFENFLMCLNRAVRRFSKQRDEIFAELKEDKYYNDNKMHEDKVTLDRWIAAAERAGRLKRDQDYVIETEQKTGDKFIRIVHAKTSGRVDKISEWGAGVHQCVAAWEKSQMSKKEGEALIIPPLSRTLTVADIANRLKRYKTYCGFTGTLGEKTVLAEMRIILGKEASVHIFPRAKRAIPEGEKWQWPKTDGEIVYRRGYAYPPEFLKTRKAQLEKILKAIQYARSNNLGVIIFWSTIEECRSFYQFLNDNGIYDSVQILDDTHSDEATHPSEAAVIEKAKNPRMVTITTAAGSRGTNFRARRMMEIIAKPASQRVIEQEMGRVSRDDDFGIGLEIYCDEDIPEIPEAKKDPEAKEVLEVKLESKAESMESGAAEEKIQDPSSKANFRVRCEFWQAGEQAKDLQRIRHRAPLRAIIQAMSEAFIRYRSDVNEQDREQFKQRWANWLQTTSDYIGLDEPTKVAMLKAWDEYFAGNAWQAQGRGYLVEAIKAATEEASAADRARQQLMVHG